MRKEEKIRNFMAKGLTLVEAERLIAYGQDDYLTIEELKIKYGNDNMDNPSAFPEWLKDEDLVKMCFKTAKEKFKELNMRWFTTPEDLADDLYIWARIRLHWFNSHAHLKTALINRCMNIARDVTRKEVMKRPKADDLADDKMGLTYCLSYDKIIDNSENDKKFNYLALLKKDQDKEEILSNEQELVTMIRSVRNKEVRDLLIVCGYLLAKIDTLKEDYENVIENCDEITQKNLLSLSYEIYDNEIIENYKKSNFISQKQRVKKNVTFTDIVKAFGTDSFESLKTRKCAGKSLINSLRKYISYTMFDGEYFDNYITEK